MKLYLSLSINERINLKGGYCDHDKKGRVTISISELNMWGLNPWADVTSMPYHKSMDCNGFYC